MKQGSIVQESLASTRSESSTLSVDVFERSDRQWTTVTLSVQELLDRQELPELLLAFFPPDLKHGSTVADRLPAKVRERLSSTFKIPAAFWAPLAQEASGFFGCQDDQGRDGSRFYCTFFRFLIKEVKRREPTNANDARQILLDYTWHKLGFFTSWSSSGKVAVFCFDLPHSLKDAITLSLRKAGSPALTDAFSVHTTLVEEVVALFDTALWQCRHLVRNIEKSRPSIHPQPDYTIMHEIARHAIHSSETLDMALETLRSMIDEQEVLARETAPDGTTMTALAKEVRRSFRFQSTILKCLHLRSKALEERLRNETNLVLYESFPHSYTENKANACQQAFNMVSQYDSRIQVRIGEATQSDSTAMKMVSFLGFLFLPGTFVSAVFSTSFFNFSPGGGDQPPRWTVSEKFWVYWVTAIPATAVVMGLGLAWLRILGRKSLPM